VYIWEGLYTEKAAKRLFIHVNTLRYRLQKIRDLRLSQVLVGTDSFSLES